MKGILVFCMLVLAMLVSSCKYSRTPEGKFTDQYTSNYLPVPNGTGTMHITNSGDEQIDFLFTSWGNPDIQINNIPYTVKNNIWGTYFKMHCGSSTDYPWLDVWVTYSDKTSFGFYLDDSSAFAPAGYYIHL